MEITFVNNQSEVRQNSEKDYKTIRHGTASHRIESFAIAILDALINCEFPLTHCSLPLWTMLSLIASSILKE